MRNRTQHHGNADVKNTAVAAAIVPLVAGTFVDEVWHLREPLVTVATNM